ncbi:hypothetical protein ACOMHN_027689 [Nucella lapillus]
MSDKAESSHSPIHSDPGTSVARPEEGNLDKSPHSPGRRGEGHHHHLVTRARVGLRLDDPDHGQFYPMSSQSFVAVSQESQGDDLPVVFSSAGQEDDSSKVYSCHICHFRTAFKNSLVNHQAVHSDARPWICEICDYAAKRKQDLKKHLQTMHGMIVDSLSLRMGSIPQTCVSSSSLSSPVDTKPVIAHSAVSSEEGGGLGGVNSAGHMTQQQPIPAFRPPLASSAMLSPPPRSAPAAVKIKEDHFSFCRMPGEERSSNRFIPTSSTDTGLSHLKQEFRKELESKHSSSLENFFLQKLHKDEQRIHSSWENAGMKSCGAHSESTDVRNLPPVSKVLPKRVRNNSSSLAEECSSAKTSTPDSFPCSDPLSSEGIVRSEALSSHAALYPQSGGTEPIHRRKRASTSSSDFTSIKVPRFQSSGSDVEGCPQVTSQSDRGGNVESISSTVTHSRALETKKSFHCGHCDILFFESAMYLMHAGLHDVSHPWKCSICGRTFFEKYSFTSHFINQH